jgi:hypothetical protein
VADKALLSCNFQVVTSLRALFSPHTGSLAVLTILKQITINFTNVFAQSLQIAGYGFARISPSVP